MPEKSVTAFEDLEFGPIAEGSPVSAALLWGNPEVGPAAVLVRFPEGFEEPFHSHSSTYHSVLVKGEFLSRDRDNPDNTRSYGPGSYAVQPGGEIHAEVNAGTGEMVALVYFEGPIDFQLAE
jgi:quercetin dioxygenase-like cupin family protein